MTRSIEIAYLFDPLCGWCYGASPVVQHLAATPGLTVVPTPVGLFSGEGARAMNADFAAYAWMNDRRIQELTGQRFSETYHRAVLGDPSRPFDSGPATLALTAAALEAPRRELDTLRAIQEARFVEGRDITAVPVLADILARFGLDAAATRIVAPDAELRAADRARVVAARREMQAFGAEGVPALIASDARGRRLLGASALFGSVDDLLARLDAG